MQHGSADHMQFIPKLVELHQKGQFPVERLCKVYPVSEMETALHDMHEGVIKPVLQWS
jgi:Zn-dependent alcohol dehydrogenase